MGLVSYTRMTLGLKNASELFQWVVNDKYQVLKGNLLEAYQDDISVARETV
jgi:hypothetical protein